MLALQPVLEDALLAPHLLALAPAALAEQSAHGALVTHWSHPVSGHTLVTPCQWSHTGVVTLSVGHCCAMVVPGDTRQHCPWPPARVGVVTTGRPPDTPTPGPQPGARRSMSVDLWTLFLLSPHFIEQIKSTANLE